MIDPAGPAFPNNIIQLLHMWLEDQIDDDPNPKTKVKVYMRPLKPTDPQQSIGIYPRLWLPDEQSYEIGRPFVGPTLQTYNVQVQCFVKDMDEVKGLNAHSVLAFLVRRILYYDQGLRLALGQLNITVGGITERLQRFGVRSGGYVSNEIDGKFNYLTTLDTFFETETS